MGVLVRVAFSIHEQIPPLDKTAGGKWDGLQGVLDAVGASLVGVEFTIPPDPPTERWDSFKVSSVTGAYAFFIAPDGWVPVADGGYSAYVEVDVSAGGTVNSSFSQFVWERAIKQKTQNIDLGAKGTYVVLMQGVYADGVWFPLLE